MVFGPRSSLGYGLIFCFGLVLLLASPPLGTAFALYGVSLQKSSFPRRFLGMGGIKQSFGSSGGEMRIKIAGTTNAYTTLRPFDVVLYGLSEPIDGKSRSIGYFKAESKEVVPLCNRVPGCTEFYSDSAQSPLSADSLKQAGLMLRVVSSDRRHGDNCFIVEEYLDSDIHIPVVTEEQAKHTITKSKPKMDFRPGVKVTGAPTPALSEIESNLGVNDVLLTIQQQLQATNKLLASTIANLEQMPSIAQESNSQRHLSIEEISTDKAPSPVGPYSQAMRANGFIFLSGALGLDPTTGKLVEGGIVFETGQALDNIKAILEATGSSTSKIVKTTIFLKDMQDAIIVNNLYKDFFSETGGAFPARSMFQVAQLPCSASIEIECIAVDGT